MTDSTKNLPRLLCEPHDGSRSTKFLKFARDFKSGCSAEFAQNDDYSAWIAMTDLDKLIGMLLGPVPTSASASDAERAPKSPLHNTQYTNRARKHSRYEIKSRRARTSIELCGGVQGDGGGSNEKDSLPSLVRSAQCTLH